LGAVVPNVDDAAVEENLFFIYFLDSNYTSTPWLI
jgi:hypothetical protein